MKCPFIYADNRECAGEIIAIVGYDADVAYSLVDSQWELRHTHPKSHWHLRCSLKGRHASPSKPDPDQMKKRINELKEIDGDGLFSHMHRWIEKE